MQNLFDRIDLVLFQISLIQSIKSYICVLVYVCLFFFHFSSFFIVVFSQHMKFKIIITTQSIWLLLSVCMLILRFFFISLPGSMRFLFRLYFVLMCALTQIYMMCSFFFKEKEEEDEVI